MPVIAIGGAIIAGIEAAGAVGTVLAGGFAALDTIGALSITAALGATLGAIGVVTHDKTLSMAGLVIGGIGAIGSLASAAGLFDGTSSLFGSASDAAASSFPDSVAVTDQIAGSGIGGASDAAGASSGIVDSFGAVNTQALDPATELAQQTDAAAGLGQTAGTGATPVSQASGAAGTTPVTGVTSATGAPSTSSALLQQPTVPSAPSAPVTGAPSAPTVPGASIESELPGGAPQAAIDAATNPKPGFLGGLSKFISGDKSGMIGYGLIQTGGSLVEGLFNPLPAAQVDALSAQAAANRAAASISSQQAANMAAPIPVASRTPQVTGSTGLINSRPPTSAVTGAPAA